MSLSSESLNERLMTYILFFILQLPTALAQRMPDFGQMQMDYNGDSLLRGAYELNKDIPHVMMAVAIGKTQTLLDEGFTAEDILKVQTLLFLVTGPQAKQLLKDSALQSERFKDADQQIQKLLLEISKDAYVLDLAQGLHVTVFHLNLMDDPANAIYEDVARLLVRLLSEAVPYIKKNPVQVNQTYINVVQKIFENTTPATRSRINFELVSPTMRNEFDRRGLTNLWRIPKKIMSTGVILALSGPFFLTAYKFVELLHPRQTLLPQISLQNAAVSGVTLLLMLALDQVFKARRDAAYRSIEPKVDLLYRDCRRLLSRNL